METGDSIESRVGLFPGHSGFSSQIVQMEKLLTKMGCFSLESRDVSGMRVPRWKDQKEEVWLLAALPEVLPWVFDICLFVHTMMLSRHNLGGSANFCR